MRKEECKEYIPDVTPDTEGRVRFAGREEGGGLEACLGPGGGILRTPSSGPDTVFTLNFLFY